MFQLPQGSEAEGTSEENPILLPGCSNAEFESLMMLLTTSTTLTPLELSKEEWIAILKLATMWDILNKLEKFKLGRMYKVESWFTDGCGLLIDDFQDTSLEDIAAALGWETAAKIASAAWKQSLPKDGIILVPSNCWLCRECHGGLQQAYNASNQIYCVGCGRYTSLEPGVKVEIALLDFSKLADSELIYASRRGASPEALEAVKAAFGEELKEMY
ncbi:hypothetical protein H1R20_g4682, partial [Candolleomyces eurysporus]